MSEERKNGARESDNLLEISDLHVQYNTDDAVVHALNGLSLKVKKGAKLGLVGETGAGKTTLALSVLRLLPAGVGEITEGSIIYDGDDLLKQPESFMLGLRGEKISMIFQDPMTPKTKKMSARYPFLRKSPTKKPPKVISPAARSGTAAYLLSGWDMC